METSDNVNISAQTNNPVEEAKSFLSFSGVDSLANHLVLVLSILPS